MAPWQQRSVTAEVDDMAEMSGVWFKNQKKHLKIRVEPQLEWVQTLIFL